MRIQPTTPQHAMQLCEELAATGRLSDADSALLLATVKHYQFDHTALATTGARASQDTIARLSAMPKPSESKTTSASADTVKKSEPPRLTQMILDMRLLAGTRVIFRHLAGLS